MKGPEAAEARSERAVGARHAAKAALHPSPEPRSKTAASPALWAFERQRSCAASRVVPRSNSLRPCKDTGAKAFFVPRKQKGERNIMKVKNLVSKRYKETPADCQIASQALMMRGGYIKDRKSVV